MSLETFDTHCSQQPFFIGSILPDGLYLVLNFKRVRTIHDVSQEGFGE